MNEIYIMKTFGDFALVFAILNYIYASMGNHKGSGFVYIYLCLVIYGVYMVKKRYGTIAIILLLLVVPLLVLAKGVPYIIFILVLFSFACYLSFNGMDNMNYYISVDRFKKGMLLIASVFIVSLMSYNLDIMGDTSIPYMIIYIISSVILLRTLRYIEFNGNNRDLTKISMRYAVFVTSLSFLLGIDAVRNFIFHGLLYIYNGLINVFLYLFSWIFLGIGYGAEFTAMLFQRLIMKRGVGQVNIKAQESPFKNVDINREDLLGILLKNRLINILMQAAVIFIVIYIIVTLFRRSTRGKSIKDEYTESREFIKADRAKGIFRKIPPILRPGKYDECIRYYYKRFLQMCISRKIDIKDSNTTFEISKKSSKCFDSTAVDSMRQMYIGVRYGNVKGDRELTKDFINCYKRLK